MRWLKESKDWLMIEGKRKLNEFGGANSYNQQPVNSKSLILIEGATNNSINFHSLQSKE